MFLVVQHVDRSLTPNGRLVVVTPHPDFFAGYWMAQLFPSYTEIERARFPGEAELGTEFEAAGFASSRFIESWERRSYGRDLVLRRIRGRFASTFELIPDDVAAEGRHVLQDARLRAPVDEFRRRRSRSRPLRRRVHQEHDPVGIGCGDRLEQHGIDDRENGRVGANAEGQRRDRRQAEPGRFD